MAEEVADEPLGALIQVLEIGGKLGFGIPTKIRRWSDADLRCSIDEKEEHLTRGEDGAAEERRRNPRWYACCWPSAWGKKEGLGFLEELKEEEGNEGSGR